VNAASVGPMVERDWFRRFLERVLPWFDPDRYQRERASRARVLSRAERVIAAYEHFDQMVRR
jgi:hypothetical protein